MKLFLGALGKFSLGLILVGALLFLPAGTFSYPNAWLFLLLLFLPMLILGGVLLVASPKLLQKRLDSKETQGAQKVVVGLSALMFLSGFVVAGLDRRFSWSQMPLWVVIASSVLLVLSYGVYAEVMRENAYLSRTVGVQEGQRVVDTGLYGVVRHPMYAATVLLFLSIPLVLGSFWSLLCFLPYPFLIAVRILNEEKLLKEGLEGYGAYCQRVKYRLIPFVW